MRQELPTLSAESFSFKIFWKFKTSEYNFQSRKKYLHKSEKDFMITEADLGQLQHPRWSSL